MKKKFFASLAAAAVVAAGYMGYGAYCSQSVDDALLLENVEALAGGDAPSPCDNINGYRQWETSGGFLKKEKSFYDCCYKQRVGYSPEGTCMKY